MKTSATVRSYKKLAVYLSVEKPGYEQTVVKPRLILVIAFCNELVVDSNGSNEISRLGGCLGLKFWLSFLKWVSFIKRLDD